MPALSGSDKAYRQARAGIERAGASRAGYFIPNVVVTINGSAVVVKLDSLSITLALNDEPDSATFLMKPGTAAPTPGNVVVIGLGTAGNPEFAGQIIDMELERTQGLADPWIHVSCIDWNRVFNGRLITADFSGQSATTIAQTIVADYTTGFFDYGVKSGMATVDEFICINETPTSALARLANTLGGAGLCGDALKIVHLWDSAGPSSAYTPTAPTTLTNSLSTLKAFTAGYDFSQIRTRVIVEGRSAKALVALPSGADTATYGMPVDYGWMFSPIGQAGQCRIGTDVVWFTDRTGKSGLEQRPETEVTADASPGDTSISVTSNVDFPLDSWYLDSNGNYFYAHNPFITGGIPGPTNAVNGIPVSGYGAILQELPTGSKIYGVDTLHHIQQDALGTILGLVSAYEDGESVVVHWEEDDVVAQAAVAAASGIAGDDGVREHPVSDPELSYAGAELRAQAELAVFGDQLVRASWTTYDMNAKPGAQQAINITGIGALSTTLTVESVTLDFPLPDYPPRRTCQGSTVKLATILDAIKG